MPAYPAERIVKQQRAHQYPQRMLLMTGSRVFGHAPAVEPSLVTDADAVGIVTSCMRSYLLQWTGGDYLTVLANVKVITRTLEAPATVIRIQIMLGIGAVFPRGRTVNHNQVNVSHTAYILDEHSLAAHCCASAAASCVFKAKSSVCISRTFSLVSK